jgi:Transcriptional regulator, AbiEi antitoxin
VTRSAPLPKLGELAQDQWGLVTRRQAELAGVGTTTLERLAAPGGSLERVARGVYQVAGAPIPDHRDLKAAWLQLAPAVPAWERTVHQGAVSHRSAAAAYGLGHLTADWHEFTVPERRQTRRSDVRFHVGPLRDAEWIVLRGLLVTRPSRIASDLLRDHEDPESVAQLIVDSIRGVFDYPGTFADALGDQAHRFGLRRGDGLGLLRWLLGLTSDPQAPRWLEEAIARPRQPSPQSGAKA